jgi:hypothetical protein
LKLAQGLSGLLARWRPPHHAKTAGDEDPSRKRGLAHALRDDIVYGKKFKLTHYQTILSFDSAATQAYNE